MQAWLRSLYDLKEVWCDLLNLQLAQCYTSLVSTNSLISHLKSTQHLWGPGFLLSCFSARIINQWLTNWESALFVKICKEFEICLLLQYIAVGMWKLWYDRMYDLKVFSTSDVYSVPCIGCVCNTSRDLL